MRQYEFALVLKESAGKDEVKAKKIATDLVSSVKGKIIKSTTLGMRSLAYPIKKQTNGWYGIFVVELPEDLMPELDKQVRINESVIRYLLVRVEPRDRDK